jgi:hypothetical protein
MPNDKTITTPSMQEIIAFCDRQLSSLENIHKELEAMKRLALRNIKKNCEHEWGDDIPCVQGQYRICKKCGEIDA